MKHRQMGVKHCPGPTPSPLLLLFLWCLWRFLCLGIPHWVPCLRQRAASGPHPSKSRLAMSSYGQSTARSSCLSGIFRRLNMFSLLAIALAVSEDAAAPAPEHVERVLAAPQAGARGHGRSSDYPRPEPAEHSGCWDEQMEGSFLQTDAAMKPQIDSDKWKQDYNWFSNDKLNAAGKFPNRWADVPKLGLTGAESQPARASAPPPRPPPAARRPGLHRYFSNTFDSHLRNSSSSSAAASRARAACACLHCQRPPPHTPPTSHTIPSIWLRLSHVDLCPRPPPQIRSGRTLSRGRGWTSRCGGRCSARCRLLRVRSLAGRSSPAANAKRASTRSIR